MMVLVATRILFSSPRAIFALPAIITPIAHGSALLGTGEEFVQWAFLLTERMGGLSVLFSIIMFIRKPLMLNHVVTPQTDSQSVYDRYHQQCVKYRWEVGGNRLGVQSCDRSERRAPRAMLDFLAMPAGFAFGVVPILHAQFMHMFTDRLTYTVSSKPKGNDHRRRDVEKGIEA